MATDKYTFKGTGLTPEEVKSGQKRYDDYLASFPHLQKNYGNLQSLEEIVWMETIQERNKRQVGNLAMEDNPSDTDPSIIPSTTLQKSIQDGFSTIMLLKAKLGMFEETNDVEEEDMVETLMTKFENYRKTHLDATLLTCPRCADQFLLVRKMEEYDDKTMPFYEEALLNNRTLFKIYKEGRITKEQVAEVLGISIQYVEWLEKKVYGLGTLPDREQDPKLE
jgi:hypothetical protein